MTDADPARRSARARRAILDATQALLAEVGFDRLTIEAIAARAGTGKQTLYRWWPSKAAVVFDVLFDAGADAGSQTLPDTGDVRADLALVLRAVVDELSDPATDALHRSVAAQIQHDPAVADELVQRLIGPQLAAMAERLRRAQDNGQIRANADPQIATELLLGPLFHRWLLRTAPLDHRYADDLVDHALNGLSAQG